MNSTIDTLTGLETYTSFQERLEEQLADAEKNTTLLSLALIDIDFFKRINDDHGTDIGDGIISAIAGHLQEHVSDAGIVYRCGGEEFGVILPGMDKEEAFLLMERTRSEFTVHTDREVSDAGEKITTTVAIQSDQDLSAKGETVTSIATFSVGVATWPDDGSSGQDLIRKADEALYRAKQTGRNRVCLAREEKMVTKTSYYTQSQLDRLSKLAKQEGVGEAVILREALDDVIRKYVVREV
jgi:diguanylate cyclase (GGDEF)-like protein